MTESPSKTVYQQTDLFVKYLEKVYIGGPHLPASVVKHVVAATPWLALIGGILSSIMAVANLQSALEVSRTVSNTGVPETTFWIQLVLAVFQALSGYLLLRAFDPLRSRFYAGWLLLFWNELLNAFQAFFELVATGAISATGLLIAVFLVLYFLFEIKRYYR